MKYKLTKNKIELYGTKLFQIEATASFGNVEKGELGGYIEKEGNLSQDGNSWVSGNAQVYGDAQVYGNAQVSGDAWVYGKLKLLGGFFFGVRWNGEKTAEVEIEDGNYLVYKGDAKFGEEQKSLIGSEATVEVGGKKYRAKIVSEE